MAGASSGGLLGALKRARGDGGAGPVSPSYRSQIVHELGNELQKPGGLPKDALRVVFEMTHEPAARTKPSLYLFLLLAAPIARRVYLGRLDEGAKIGEYTVKDIQAWYWWLDTLDPLSAAMVDLYCAGGLSIKSIADCLALPQGAIIRDLRFAKRWLGIQLPDLPPLTHPRDREP